MTPINNLIAIYDFEFFPYALGDVLTWNIRTAMRCEELGKNAVDIYICADERYPASIYQRGLINPDNFELFFSELYGAFGTHPKLGNIYIFRQREAMVNQLREATNKDKSNLEAFSDYLNILSVRNLEADYSKNKKINMVGKIYYLMKNKMGAKTILKKILKRVTPKVVAEAVYNNMTTEDILNRYFIKYIYSHNEINKYAAKKGSIPLLKPSLGCTPDIDELIARRFQGKKIVPFHLRLRRLDVGYGGDHSYARDSNFLEWYDFLRQAAIHHPDVQFIALGRLQEKPLDILRLPNVTSLRVHGMGLGHELTLMLRSDLFIGTSSGFAALANFSMLPYFITRMNPGSCDAYAIPQGAEKLPFAQANQHLVYEQETSELLLDLLQKGLKLTSQKSDLSFTPIEAKTIDVANWLKNRGQLHNTAATTSRFYSDENYRSNESVFLLLPYLEQARKSYLLNDMQTVNCLLNKLNRNFADLCKKMPEYLLLSGLLALENKNIQVINDCLKDLNVLETKDEVIQSLIECLVSILNNEAIAETLNNLKLKVESYHLQQVAS